jgi:hypothetical protein
MKKLSQEKLDSLWNDTHKRFLSLYEAGLSKVIRDVFGHVVSLMEAKNEDDDVSDGWISVEDKMPSQGKFVFAYSDKELKMKMQVVNLYDGSKSSSGIIGYQLNGNCMHRVTHWMPLPEPPKQ